jgi:poly(hydroxyalkanoate) granule-associated protein
MATTPIDQPGEGGRRPGEAARDALRGFWYASLGLAAVIGEETGRAVGTLVRKGRQIEPRVLEHGRKAGEDLNDAMNEVGGRIKGFAEKVGRGADENVAAALRRMGYPTKEEVEQLNAKLADLAARLEELARKGRQ